MPTNNRSREVVFQIAFAALHLTYLILGAGAVAHHARRAYRAALGHPLGPGV